MAATVMGRYIRDMASDTAQEHYPGRPIRPLPTRRLRERLSPEAADKIVYPLSAAPAMSPVFFYPQNSTPEDERAQRQHPTDRARQEEIDHNYILRRSAKEAASDEDYTGLAFRSQYSRRHSPYLAGLSPGRSYRYTQKIETAYEKPAAPASTTSSVDGYDSFENTNNKKKRKIPTPGDAISNGILLQNDLALLGISNQAEEAALRGKSEDREGQLHGSPAVASGDGLRGSRRGCLGRGRSPIQSWPRALTFDLHSSEARQAPSRDPQPADIISPAISHAENYKKENLKPGGNKASLLDTAASQKPNPTAAQFTFTCDSQVPSSVAWPARPLPLARNMGQPQSTLLPQKKMPPPHNVLREESGSSPRTKKTSKPAAARKNRRVTGVEYLIAARERREFQERQNFHHPPSPEDQWICEFCEYESIFGGPPVALIRQYEIKDRLLRKQEAERRRLLEKAKMKGRKSKKGPKPSAKNGAPSQNQTQSKTRSRENSSSQVSGHYRGKNGSDTYSMDADPGDPEEEFIDDDDAPPLVQRMTPPNAPAENESRPRARAAQGGAGSSERLVS